MQRLDRAGRGDPGGGGAGRGGHPEHAGDLPVGAVVQQAYPDAGRQVQRPVEGDLDPLLTGVRSLPSAQAVAGLPSNAFTGSSCWVSAIQEP